MFSVLFCLEPEYLLIVSFLYLVKVTSHEHLYMLQNNFENLESLVSELLR